MYFMKHKSETLEKFKEFQSEVENHRNKKIKFLRSDRRDKYLSYEFGLHLKLSDHGFRQNPQGSNTGVRAEISFLPIYILAR